MALNQRNLDRTRHSIAAVLVGVAALVGASASADEGYEIGNTFPGFTAQTMQGNPFNSDDVLGKFVLIDFCTIWCAPCQSMAPDADDVSDALNASGIDFVYVQALMEDNSGLPADQSDAAAWSSALSVSSPPVVVLHPEGQFDSPMVQAWAAFNTSSVPTLVVLDPDGVILEVTAGAQDQEQLISTIETLVNNPAPCPSDVNDDAVVDVTDLLILLANWGVCDEPCAGDTNSDFDVNVTDLLAVLAAWGPCE